MTVALDTDQAKTLGVGLVVALLVAAVLINLVVARVVTRIIVLVVFVALAAVVWTQRSNIQSAAKNCDATFFGLHLSPSDPTLKAHCQQVTNR